MKILAFAADGSEDSELITTLSLFKRAGIETYLLSVSGELLIKGSHGNRIMCDALFSSLSLQALMDYDGLFFPGGKRGVELMRNNEQLLKLVRAYSERMKPVMAICAAPSILGVAGVLDGKQFTCYDGFETFVPNGIYMKGKDSVRDKNIITGRSAGYTINFALEAIKYLLGDEARTKVAKAILLEA